MSAGPADLVIGNNVLAQVPDLNDFVGRDRDPARARRRRDLEFPHVVRLIEGVQFDTIYHEHFSYFSLAPRRHGSRQHTTSWSSTSRSCRPTAGSLRVYLGRATAGRPVGRPLRRSSSASGPAATPTLDGYVGFEERVREAKRALLDVPDRGAARRDDRSPGTARPARATRCSTTAGSGPTSSTTRSTGTRTSTAGSRRGRASRSSRPGAARGDAAGLILILPWNLRDEIARQLEYTREWGARLVVPIPTTTEVA